MGGNGMDWHAWLSAARLEPALVYEYALLFARNELEADDVAYFDHEFLHSMGVSVAKHRLEILKLARPGRSRSRSRGRFPASSSPASLSGLLAAVDRVARYVLSLVHREESSALVLVPSQQQPDVPCSNSKRGGNNKAVKRTRSKPKAAAPKATRPAVLAIGGRGAATVHAIKDVEKGGGEEMVRWDRLFQDLKPN